MVHFPWREKFGMIVIAGQYWAMPIPPAGTAEAASPSKSPQRFKKNSLGVFAAGAAFVDPDFDVVVHVLD
jgi:hypothetical protein